MICNHHHLYLLLLQVGWEADRPLSRRIHHQQALPLCPSRRHMLVLIGALYLFYCTLAHYPQQVATLKFKCLCECKRVRLDHSDRLFNVYDIKVKYTANILKCDWNFKAETGEALILKFCFVQLRLYYKNQYNSNSGFLHYIENMALHGIENGHFHV